MGNKNPTKILLLGPRLVRNLGGPSLLPTTICVLNKYFPQAEYTFITPTKEDLELSSIYGLNILPVPKMWKILLPSLMLAIFKIRIGDANIRQVVDAFSKSDIVIQMWGIWFADQIGGNKFLTRFNQSVYFIVAKLFGKLCIKYTADLGPFNARWNRVFAYLSLQYFTDLILARSDETSQRLKELGVTTSALVLPDTAFLLVGSPTQLSEQLTSERASKPIIGISVSHQGARQSGDREKYITTMAGLADYIIETIHAKVLLIPNEVSDDENYDDVHFVKQVFTKMNRNEQALEMSGNFSASEMKGIIGICDTVVASRYHTIIACLSQKTPVLVLGWHEKYLGVLRLFGQDKYLFSVSSVEVQELMKRFDELWMSRQQVSQEIGDALPGVIEEIYRGGEAVLNLVNQRG
jgi:colanic acid/amylovoran biosynthesis protein